ncbi:sensor domain-containing diguanylate cyclase [Pusillimonas sp. CC-YST705]|uniref:diguanylate cyclase n=2 Tax=Mesopusillimonas faecipullorum TaxID=2755040 RepID=A0ABS8CBR9_9BURK|nr:sensor domain-containing diguanylate cyclase [Mesopusillimonas faecipullorum]
MALPPDVAWLQSAVSRAVHDLGILHAWAYLDLPDEKPRLFHDEGLSVTLRSAVLQLAHVFDDELGDGKSVAWIKGQALNTLSEVLQNPVQACLLGALALPDGSPCGHLVWVLAQPPVSAPAYEPALQALLHHVRYAVFSKRVFEKKLERLQEAVDQYESLLQSAPVLFNAFEEDGQCVMWNKECERRLGWNQQEVFEHPEPLSLFYPDLDDRKKVIASVSSSPSLTFQEWAPRARNGERVHTIWSNVRLHGGRVLNIGIDITERKKAEIEVVRLSKIDALTECWNRKEIVERLSRALAARRQSDPSFVVMMLDLDYFKSINDSYGHLRGDLALQHFCKHLRSCLRGMDQLGRLGGEEFLILLQGKTEEAAEGVFARLRESLQAHPVMLGDEPVVLTVSAGIAAPRCKEIGVSEILRRADQALYQAKQQGRDRVCVYPS